MMPSSPSNNGSVPHNTLQHQQQQQQQQQQQRENEDDITLTSLPRAASPSSSSTSVSRLALTNNNAFTANSYSSHSQPYAQSNNNRHSNSTAGYLSPLSAQQHNSTIPQVRSPLSMGSSTGNQGSNSSTLTGRTINYNRGRRDSFQHSPLAFSPTLAHNNTHIPSQISNLGGSAGGAISGGSGGLYSQHSRIAQLWSSSPSGATDPSSNSRMRCLSSSSVDSNASSVGFSHLTPAMAAMSVQHAHQHHQASPTNSAYESYGTSPQHGGFQHYYHTQQQQPHQSSTTSSSYPYHSPFSSPLQQTQVPAAAYDSLSMAASTIATSLYGTTSSTYASSSTDLMYPPSHYGQVSSAVPGAQGYNAARYGSGSSMIALAPSLYSDQDTTTRMPQQQQHSFETHSPLSATGPGGARPFDYSDQYQQQSQAEYYGQQQQQGLGILVSGGMARGMSATPEAGVNHDDGDQQQLTQQQQQEEDQYSGEDCLLGPIRRLKRNNSVTGLMQTPDDIQPILGKDGKTLVYLCPKCTSTTKEFTTKSNLKRHLENKNIHNTPYQRRRDQKRWQGHEKKQVCRAETTQRMRTWRSKNPEKNRFNDMRCRVYKLARAKFGDYYSQAKEDFVVAEIDRRKKMMLMRNNRRAEWANQANASGNTTGTGSVGPTSVSPSASPVSAAAVMAGYHLPNTDFTFSSTFGDTSSSSSMMGSQQIPGFENVDSVSADTGNDGPSKDNRDTASSDDRFYSDLAQGKLPPRRRSRSAMQPPVVNEAQSGNGSPSAIPGVVSSFASFPSGSFQSGDSSCKLLAPSFAYQVPTFPQHPPPSSSLPARRIKKQRSVTENPGMFRQSPVYSTSPASDLGPYSGGYANMVGGASFQGSYMDSNQQLQMLQEKYYPDTVSQPLLMSKTQQHQQQQPQQQQQQQHDPQSIESVVEGMEINQAMDLVSSAASTTTASAGGMYGDRDASAWLTPSATYTSNQGSGSGHNTVDDNSGSGGFPFPMIRDRKELARAAGIRLDIPTSRQQQQHQWMHSMDTTGSPTTVGETGTDEMVGGSATSHESPVTGDLHSTSQSPLPLGTTTSTVTLIDSDADANGGNLNANAANDEGSNLSNGAYARTKGSNLEVFPAATTSSTTAAAAAAAADASYFTVGVSAAADYLAKDVPVIRRHSTHLSNLAA
ncbi:hypothetical protein BGX28_009639 [Mortierella sp. GBA30]|nr:hypothetical protein BGX28_009639 [Mortierella sp. GBA30]